MHGAGVIETIEEREILGKKQQYYVIKMPVTNMQIMVPVEKASNVAYAQLSIGLHWKRDCLLFIMRNQIIRSHGAKGMA